MDPHDIYLEQTINILKEKTVDNQEKKKYTESNLAEKQWRNIATSRYLDKSRKRRHWERRGERGKQEEARVPEEKREHFNLV